MGGSYAAYEAEKAAWITVHPTATHSEYERAMREIARRLRN